MQAIHPILSVGQYGTDIADLHEALDHLGFSDQIPQDEREEQRYGEDTAEAVRWHNNNWAFARSSLERWMNPTRSLSTKGCSNKVCSM